MYHSLPEPVLLLKHYESAAQFYVDRFIYEQKAVAEKTRSGSPDFLTHLIRTRSAGLSADEIANFKQGLIDCLEEKPTYHYDNGRMAGKSIYCSDAARIFSESVNQRWRHSDKIEDIQRQLSLSDAVVVQSDGKLFYGTKEISPVPQHPLKEETRLRA